jgi:hypothetical protein
MPYAPTKLEATGIQYNTCFDPNGSSSGDFSYTSFTIELQRESHTFLLRCLSGKKHKVILMQQDANNKEIIDNILLPAFQW